MTMFVTLHPLYPFSGKAPKVTKSRLLTLWGVNHIVPTHNHGTSKYGSSFNAHFICFIDVIVKKEVASF